MEIEQRLYQLEIKLDDEIKNIFCKFVKIKWLNRTRRNMILSILEFEGFNPSPHLKIKFRQNRKDLIN